MSASKSRATSFREVYRRSCDGSITTPLLSPSGRTLVICGATFSGKLGEYLGAAPVGLLALVDDETGLGDPHSGEGLTLESVIENPEGRRSTGAGTPEFVAVSSDGIRSISMERTGSWGSGRSKVPSWALVERELPSLAEKRHWRLENHADGDRAGFLTSGEPWVLTSTECKIAKCGASCWRPTCNRRALFRAGEASLEVLVDDVARAEVSRNGSRALVTYANAKRAVVELPTGSTVVELPDEREDDRGDFGSPAAIDAAGERIAYIDHELRVARVRDRSLTPIAVDDLPFPSELAFSVSGHELLVGAQSLVHVLRDDAKASALPKPRIFPPPAGYTSSVIRGAVQSFGKFEEESEIVWPNQIARWRDESGAYDVYVFAEDPRELGQAKDTTAWSRLASKRFEGAWGNPERLVAWGRAGSRSLEYVIEVRDGCDPQDRYVRMSERDGILYRIVVSAPPGASPQVMAPVLERVIDSALGTPERPRKLARTSEPSREPC